MLFGKKFAAFSFSDSSGGESGGENPAPAPQENSAPEPPVSEEIAAIGGEILAAQPGVQQHAIDEHARQQDAARANVPLDDFGTPFDSAIHTGSKLKSGAWRVKRNAKPSGSHVATPGGTKSQASGNPGAQEIPTEDAGRVQALAAGQAAAGAVFMLCRGFLGDEWKPSPDEVTMQSEAWGNYFLAKGVTDFPPGLTLVVALGAYAGPRMQMPKTQAKISRAKSWFVLRAAKWRIKRKLRQMGVKADVQIIDGDLVIDGQSAEEWAKKNGAQK